MTINSLIMKKILLTVLVFLSLLGTIYLFNYLSLNQPAFKETNTDSRNEGIKYDLHYKNFVFLNTLIFNLKDVSFSKSSADVFRVLLQVASALKDKKFETIVLTFRGNPKFILHGDYFERLGNEYEIQNPIYMMRTFPENLYDLNGYHAYGEWTGGMLGVVNRQLEDLNDFHDKWYKNDLILSKE